MIHIALLIFAAIWLILGLVAKDKEASEHYITRSSIFVAAGLLAYLI